MDLAPLPEPASRSAGRSAPTVAFALRAEGRTRLTTAARTACVVVSVIGVSLMLSYRANTAALVASVLALFLALSYGWLAQRLAAGRRIPAAGFALAGVLTVVFVLALSVFVGIFSPTVVGLFVVVMYWGFSDRKAEAWGVYATSAAGYLVVSGLAIIGVLDLRDSLMPLGDVSTFQLVQSVVIIEVVLAAVFRMARNNRRAAVKAFADVELAHRRIRERDALLHEARADLEHAVGANRLGRYSGLDLGEYRAAEIIGRGGGADVYRATHRDSGDNVAIKVLPLELVDDPDAVRRFFREIDVCARLVSPNITRILGSGHAPDHAPYFVMELLTGVDLAALLREQRTLSLQDTVDLVWQVSSGLSVAHAAGIVHRDLKPQNVFAIEQDGVRRWKILDFGVSKVDGAGATVGPNVLVGTPSYMAPEQITCSTNVDCRADVFALGVIAYRTLTGRPAFTGKNVTETLYNVQNLQPTRPGEVVDLPADVEAVLALSMAKAPEERFPSASALATALADAARGSLAEALRRAARNLLSRQPWRDLEVTVRDRKPRPPAHDTAAAAEEGA